MRLRERARERSAEVVRAVAGGDQDREARRHRSAGGGEPAERRRRNPPGQCVTG
jgi:hypothetical protein